MRSPCLCGMLLAGLLVVGSEARGQMRPMVPPAPIVVPQIPHVPQLLPQPLPRPTLIAPSLTPLTPAVSPIAASPTQPKPPVVRQNPPVLPNRDDDRRIQTGASNPPDDDPAWMSRALDTMSNEHPGWTGNIDVTPPPPPPPLNIPAAPLPATAPEEAKTPWSGPVVLIVMIALAAFGLGRMSRARR